MDTLHHMLRSLRGETKARRDHLDIFREFLGHLDRATARRRAWPRTRASVKGRGKKSGRR